MRDGTTAASAKGARAPSLSMGTWLAIALVGVALTSLLASSLVTVGHVSNLAGDVLTDRTRARLALQAGEVERYLRTLQRNTAALAGSVTISDAAERFGSAFLEVGADLDPAVVATSEAEVTSYYRNEFLPGLRIVTGEPLAPQRLLPTSPVGTYLQSRYVVPDPEASTSPGERLDAGDGSAWSEVHAQLHPVLVELSERLGLDDLLLIRADTEEVVYSREKAPDFATSLEVGPYSGTLLAQAVRAVVTTAQSGSVVLTDFSSYAPDQGRPAAFAVSPVLGGNEVAAVLAAKVSLDEINRIMTANGRWTDAGFGATAETFLVGQDGRMRSVARAFVEDPEAYLDAVGEAETATAQELQAMEAAGTTVVFQEVANPEELAEATAAEGLTDLTSYQGQDVFAAYEPLDVPGLDWVVGTQVAREQVSAPIEGFGRRSLVVTTLVVIVLSFVAVAWSRALFRPVRALSEKLRRIHRGEDDHGAALDPRTPREFAELAGSVEVMVHNLGRQQREVEAAIADRRATIRAMLPAAVAERVDAGERRVVDEIEAATVVVVTVPALSELVRQAGTDVRELVDRIVGELDDLAHEHGLERVKLLGDAYFAGCGLDRPYLDHAPRAVAFAAAAGAAAADLLPSPSAGHGLAIGIDTGPVTVGLAGSALLVYEMWGETVNHAHLLARTAGSGQVLLTDATQVMLPTTVAVQRVGEGAGVWRVDPTPAAGVR